jgi:hypothetical protein
MPPESTHDDDAQLHYLSKVSTAPGEVGGDGGGAEARTEVVAQTEDGLVGTLPPPLHDLGIFAGEVAVPGKNSIPSRHNRSRRR